MRTGKVPETIVIDASDDETDTAVKKEPKEHIVKREEKKQEKKRIEEMLSEKLNANKRKRTDSNSRNGLSDFTVETT